MSSRKDLTPEEIAVLQENPWIESVSRQHILYSEDFKKEAYRELMDGKSMHTVFFEHGIDPEVVGDGRIYLLHNVITKGCGTKVENIATPIWRMLRENVPAAVPC